MVVSMVVNEQDSMERRRRTDWTGIIVTALMSPVFFLFVYLGKAEIGFTAYIVACVAAVAIKLRWKSRKHLWFWVTIALVLVVQIPLLFIVRWPRTNVPTIVYSVPFGIVEFLSISGALRLAQRMFSKGDYSGHEN